MVGWYPSCAGTLNVVPDRPEVLNQLPEPLFRTQRKGIPVLQWWPGKLEVNNGSDTVVALLVRVEPSLSLEMELVTQLNMRISTGVRDGDRVYFTLNGR